LDISSSWSSNFLETFLKSLSLSSNLSYKSSIFSRSYFSLEVSFFFGLYLAFVGFFSSSESVFSSSSSSSSLSDSFLLGLTYFLAVDFGFSDSSSELSLSLSSSSSSLSESFFFETTFFFGDGL
jgi:hypothetical protein